MHAYPGLLLRKVKDSNPFLFASPEAFPMRTKEIKVDDLVMVVCVFRKKRATPSFVSSTWMLLLTQRGLGWAHVNDVYAVVT